MPLDIIYELNHSIYLNVSKRGEKKEIKTNARVEFIYFFKKKYLDGLARIFDYLRIRTF